MTPDLRKWGVIYHWEKNINRQLLYYGLQFDKLICIRKMSNGLTFIGYFTVKILEESLIKTAIFAHIYVEFTKTGKLKTAKTTLRTLNHNYILKDIPAEDLIYDKRDQFDWI